MNTKSISISLYNRPKYTKYLLDNLNLCYDIENYSITICCEPDNELVIDIAKTFRPHQTEVIVNSIKLGCNTNIFKCVALGFEKSNYNIHLEDDTIPGKDCLLYFQWCRRYHTYDDVMNISGYVNSEHKDEKFYYIKNNKTNFLKKRNWFVPWGWATWKDRFQDIKKMWDLNGTFGSWDIAMNTTIRNGRNEIFPLVSRIQNIGAELGAHVPNPEWHKNHQYNEYWIESIKSYSKEFEEIK